MDEKVQEKSEKKITAKRVIITSVLVDVLDVILSLAVALLSGSVIMLTQALEGFSDLAASGLLLIGFSRSVQKEDKTHPFGYGREMYFWTLLAGLIMFGLTATVSFYFGFMRFLHPEPVHNIFFAFLVLILTFGTNGYAFFLSLKRLLRRRSPIYIIRIFYRSSLVETKTTFILDLMGTLASFLGIISLAIYLVTGDLRFDGLGAMAISVMLGIFAFFLLEGIRDLLVGRSASLEVEGRIRNAALHVKEVDDIVDLKTLYIGSERLLVMLDVNMKDQLTTRELEHLIDKIQEKVKKEVPSVKYIQVELETRRY